MYMSFCVGLIKKTLIYDCKINVNGLTPYVSNLAGSFSKVFEKEPARFETAINIYFAFILQVL